MSVLHAFSRTLEVYQGAGSIAGRVNVHFVQDKCFRVAWKSFDNVLLPRTFTRFAESSRWVASDQCFDPYWFFQNQSLALRSTFPVSISSKIVFLSVFLGHSKFTRVLDSLRHSVAGGIIQETARRFESLPLLTVGRIRRSIGSQSWDKFFPKRSLNATCVDTIQSQLQ